MHALLKTGAALATLAGGGVVLWWKSEPLRLQKGCLVLITGASSGIGAATAKLLSRDGATVLLLARGEEQLAAVAQQIAADGGTAFAYAVDCGDADRVAEVAAQIRHKHGVPDVIVNSAGLGAWKDVLHTTPTDVTLCMAAPYFAAANVVLAFIKPMVQRPTPGVIVNINSPVAYLPWPGAMAYAAGRGALRSFHESISMDLHATSVTAVEVVFGMVRSPYFALNNVDTDAQLPKISVIIPSITEEDAAVAVRRAILSRKSAVCPWQLSGVLWLHRLVPQLTSWLMRVTFSPKKGSP
eukprot:EG_transcript_14370